MLVHVHVCTHIHMYVHVYMHICVCIHIHVYMHTCIFRCMHHVHKCIHVHVCMCICIFMCVFMFMWVHVHRRPELTPGAFFNHFLPRCLKQSLIGSGTFWLFHWLASKPQRSACLHLYWAYRHTSQHQIVMRVIKTDLSSSHFYMKHYTNLPMPFHLQI